MIIATLVGVLALSGGLSFANPSAKVYGYAISLVLIDVGMVFIAALFVIAGRPLWREDRDLRYIGVVVGFASLPVWGSIEATCVSYLIPDFSRSGVCRASPGLSWVAVAWLIAIPLLLALVDFRWFLASRAKGSAN